MPAPKKQAVRKPAARKQEPAKLATATPGDTDLALDGPEKLAAEAAAAAIDAGAIPEKQEPVSGTPPKDLSPPEHKEDPDDLLIVEVDDSPPPPVLPPLSPWIIVEELSDNEMVVEAANIQAHGRSAMLLRFRINGSLTGFVEKVDRMHYKPGAKRNSFVTR